MSELKICRICLVSNIRMHRISGSEVQDVYEKLTNKKILEDDSRYCACYMCYRQLQKCKQLATKAQRAEELLRQVAVNSINQDHESISIINRQAHGLVSLTVATLECFYTHEDVKQENEVKCDGNRVFKTESNERSATESKQACGIDSDGTSEPFKDFADGYATDSEDDLPLKSISARQSLDRRVKVKKIVLVRKNKQKDTTLDAREVLLTKEQQLEELFERSKSLNYISSPFKCGLCYKGFLDARAYENHKRKHDVSSGAFECEVCRMRYGSARLLRTHAAAAHARLFRCNKCTHAAHTINQAREHEKWHNGHTYECQLCGQKFRKSTSYLTHKRKRHPTEHVCHICGESFVGRHGLLMHKSKTHKWDQEPLVKEEPTPERFCAQCDVQFDTTLAWQRHILTSVNHTLGGDGSECKICHQSLSGESLATHMREHEKSLRQTSLAPRKLVKLACDQCEASFVGRSNLRAHVRRVHLGLKYNKNVVCELCGKKCTSNAGLKYHQRRHTGERPFPCALCDKRFPDSNQRRIHARTHTGERPYPCDVCGKRFSQKPALNRHYRVHTGVKPYECQFCSKTFNQSNSMKLHVNTVHLKLPANRKKGQNAGEKNHQTSIAGLKYHQRRHTGERPFPCALCDKRFPDSNQRRIHARTHTGERPYPCDVCGKRFSQKPALNRHYRVHTGVKPYECQFCSKTFNQSNSMKLHVNTVHLKLPANRKKGQNAGEKNHQTVN